MLTEKQVKELKEHLNKSQNPLFLFDNDQDGLCSFLILQRAYDKGKGFPIKSPELNEDYFRKVRELNPDYVFVLDMPRISKEFFEKIRQYNLPVVWVDHHLLGEDDKKNIPDFVNYYNPKYNKKPTGEPVTALCYQLNKEKKNLWLAMVGCISDGYFSEDLFYEFREYYPDLIGSLSPGENTAFDVFYKSEIGKISRLLGFGLKDRTTNVIKMMRFLKQAKTPYDILDKNEKNKEMHNRYSEIHRKYEKILSDAKKSVREEDEVIFYEYQGETSMSS